MNVNQKKCKCGKMFTRYDTIQNKCIPCSIVAMNRDKSRKAKQKRKADRLKVESLRPISWYRRRMIQAFNNFIRYRDKNEPCISCGRHHSGQYHSGHYLTTKARPWLSVHPTNASKQCYSCNVPLSGNIHEYRPKLIEKVGKEMVEYLENSHSNYSLTIEDMTDITMHYRAELKHLKAGE